MIKAFLLSVGQLTDRRILALIFKILIISLAVFAVLGIGAYYLLGRAFILLGWGDGGFAAATAAAVMTILTAILLFRIVAIAVLNIFSDDVVDAVETKHYPQRAETARPQGYVTATKMGLASAGRAVGYNLLAAPVYLVFAVTGIGTAIAFLIVNAILLGRDLQDMVAARHIGSNQAITKDWQIGRGRRFGLGLIGTLLFMVPFANFLAPIIGAAMATHMVHRHKG